MGKFNILIVKWKKVIDFKNWLKILVKRNPKPIWII